MPSLAHKISQLFDRPRPRRDPEPQNDRTRPRPGPLQSSLVSRQLSSPLSPGSTHSPPIVPIRRSSVEADSAPMLPTSAMYLAPKLAMSQPILSAPNRRLLPSPGRPPTSPLPPLPEGAAVSPALSAKAFPKHLSRYPERVFDGPTGMRHQRSRSAEAELFYEMGAGSPVPASVRPGLAESQSQASLASLVRGPSTASGSTQTSAQSYRLMSLQSLSVQQDFFLPHLQLTARQRGSLLISLPHRAVTTFEQLYAVDLDAARDLPGQATIGGHALELERLTNLGAADIPPEQQRKLVAAVMAIYSTDRGAERLARTIRWLLTGAIAERNYGQHDRLRHVTALCTTELRGLLEPLVLSAEQQALLNKHCLNVPARLVAVPRQPLQ